MQIREPGDRDTVRHAIELNLMLTFSTHWGCQRPLPRPALPQKL